MDIMGSDFGTENPHRKMEDALAEARNMPLIEPKLLHTVVEKYEGESKDNGLPHGQGTAYLRAGHKYIGSFFMGYMHGFGRYEWTDGLLYEGEMQWGTINGVGSYTWPNGTTHTGELQDGKCHGQGQQTMHDATAIYDGEWAGGVRHGRGTLIFLGKGGCQYTGEWEGDAKSGHGTVVYANGDRYEGEWRDDRKCGQGLMVWADTAEEYRGSWRDDLPDGLGEYVWWLRVPRGKIRSSQVQQCNRYLGDFCRGQRHGYGRFFYANGAYYEGQWEGNVRHGRGVFVFEDGTVVDSSWAGGKPEVPLHEVRPRSSDPKVAIDDLLLECANEDPTQARKSVGAVLLRFTSELRQIYNAYSALPIPGFVEAHELGLVPGSPDAGAYEPEGAEEGYDEGGFEGQERTLDAGRGGAFEPRNPDPNKPNEAVWYSGRPSFQLLLCQLHRMLQDCAIPNRVLPLAAIDVLVAKTRREHPAILKLREEMRATGVASVPDPLDILEDLHSPALELSFRAFCELVVRVAAAQNHHMRTLERRVHALITQHIIPALEASGGVPARHPSRARIDAPAMLDAVSQLGDHLFDLFEHIKANRYDALPRSRPATAPGVPGHTAPGTTAPTAGSGAEPAGPVGEEFGSVATLRQFLLLLTQRGVIKGTPQYRGDVKEPEPPQPEAPEPEVLKNKATDKLKEKPMSKASMSKMGVSLAKESSGASRGGAEAAPPPPPPPPPPRRKQVEGCGVTVQQVFEVATSVLFPGDVSHAVAFHEDGSMEDVRDAEDAAVLQDLQSLDTEVLYSEFVAMVSKLSELAVPDEAFETDAKLRSFVIGGLLGWQDDPDCSFPPHLPLPTPTEHSMESLASARVAGQHARGLMSEDSNID